jgi:Domain of unknown function (DUF4384)
MRTRYSRTRQVCLLVTYAIALQLILAFHYARAQQQSQPQSNPSVQDAEKETDEVEQRRMFRTFKQQRQSVASSRRNATPKNTSSGKSSNVRTSQPKSTSTGGNSPAAEDAFVGFTVWEMRESEGGTERRSFRLKKNNGQTVVMRPFRIGSETPLVAGRSYFFSIESARSGYLYIIDREQNANGKLGEPLLLFPTKGVHDGINEITAGEPVEIPDQKSENASFEAERHGQDHIGEVLTIIVSPEPLIDRSRLKDDPITLQVSEVTKWERQWGTKSRWVENTEAIGRAYTEEEGRAGGDPNVGLKENDPLPQRLYQVGAKAANPLIVTLQLRYSDSSK